MRPATRRAVGLLLLAVTVAVTCTFLGRWQWHRHVARDAAIAVVQANWAAAPVPLDEVAPDTGHVLDRHEEWRSVIVTGSYVPAATVLLRNRPVDGVAAYHVLVPFVIVGSGDVLVVDRGWVALGDDASAEVTPPAPPAGTVHLVARLRMPEQPSDRSAPAGQVQSIDVGQVLAAAGAAAPSGPAYGFPVTVVEEDPPPAEALGTLPAPSTDPGPHLSYAFQWWVFALGGLLGFSWMARRELLEDRSAAAAAPDKAPPAPRPRRKPGRDELVEDALVEAQQDADVRDAAVRDAAARTTGPDEAHDPAGPAQARATRSR